MQIDPRLSEISACLYRLSIKAIIIQDHKILLIKEQDDEWWSLPGGGIDYGEDILSALERELHEELGIGSEDAQFDQDIVFGNVGAVVAHIPKANLFVKVKVQRDKIKPTMHVKQHGWFSELELQNLYISPSTGDIKDRLYRLMSGH